MADFIIHSVPGSPYGRAVLIALEEKHASWSLRPLAPGSGKSPEHLARHPFGRIPVLEHGDFSVYETQAILRYLDRVVPTPALTPANPRHAARMDQLMNVCDWYLFHGVGNIIGFQRIVGPRLFGLEPDLKAIEAAMPQARAVVAELSRALGDQPFMTGDALSLADIQIVPHLDFLRMTPEWAELSDGRPNLDAWMARMDARPSLVATTWPALAALVASGQA